MIRANLLYVPNSIFAFGEPQGSGKIRFFLRRHTFFFLGSRHCTSVLQMQVPKLSTDLDLNLLYILISGTHSKFAHKNNFLALGVCFPQPWHFCFACEGRKQKGVRTKSAGMGQHVGFVVMSTDTFGKFCQKKSRDGDRQCGKIDGSKDGAVLLGQHSQETGNEGGGLSHTQRHVNSANGAGFESNHVSDTGTVHC